MSAITRGTKNAFRNPLRAVSVTAILGISLGLVLVMLAARAAVDNRIATVKASVGNTVTVSPAGARGFLGGGEPLSSAQVQGLTAIAHVTSVDSTVDAQMRSGTGGDTSLASAIDAGTLGGRGFRAFGGRSNTNGAVGTGNFTPLILAIGTTNPNYGGEQVGSNLTLSSGTAIDAAGSANQAVMGKNLADKNTLTVGSTFQAYGTDITVVGIYDAGNQFANNSVVFPLRTLQTLSGQADQVTQATAHVDSVDNLAGVTTAVQAKLGTSADVTSSADTVKNAVAPLESIRTIALTSFLGALLAATVITLLTMVMVVRERRREIAVLKAIGASDATIVTQFVGESVVLTLLGSVVGTLLGVVLSNPILSALLRTSTSTAGPGPGAGPDRGFGAGIRVASGSFRALGGAIGNLRAVVGLDLILYGLLAAIAVAIIGSALPAWLIGRVRPAEVLRSE